MACCPGHDDINPSLAIADKTGGGLLVHCHANCDQVDVVAALKTLNLWPGKGDIYPPSRKSRTRKNWQRNFQAALTGEYFKRHQSLEAMRKNHV